jgi:hypothetical protein
VVPALLLCACNLQPLNCVYNTRFVGAQSRASGIDSWVRCKTATPLGKCSGQMHTHKKSRSERFEERCQRGFEREELIPSPESAQDSPLPRAAGQTIVSELEGLLEHMTHDQMQRFAQARNRLDRISSTEGKSSVAIGTGARYALTRSLSKESSASEDPGQCPSERSGQSPPLSSPSKQSSDSESGSDSGNSK